MLRPHSQEMRGGLQFGLLLSSTFGNGDEVRETINKELKMHRSAPPISATASGTRDDNTRTRWTCAYFRHQLKRLVLPACFLFVAMFAQAAVRGTMRITVLDSETHSVALDTSGVPKNCDGVSFDAYCFNSKMTEVTNTLLVQEGDRPPFRITCSVDTKWSRCAPLLKGESFAARKEKRGIIVYFADDAGKLRKQFYAYVGGEPLSQEEAAAPPASPASIAKPAALSATSTAGTSPAVKNSSASREMVKCTFSSNPGGAEISLDGQYVGSTPSQISLDPGKHELEVSMPGFVSWKRELAVSPGSELTINAVLEKTP
jgi:hypothetical protein